MTRAALLLVVTVLTLMTDEAQGSWKLTAASSQPCFGQIVFSAGMSLSICPSTQAAYVLCCGHVGSLPRNCTAGSAWMGASLNSVKFLLSLLNSQVS